MSLQPRKYHAAPAFSPERQSRLERLSARMEQLDDELAKLEDELKCRLPSLGLSDVQSENGLQGAAGSPDIAVLSSDGNAKRSRRSTRPRSTEPQATRLERESGATTPAPKSEALNAKGRRRPKPR